MAEIKATEQAVIGALLLEPALLSRVDKISEMDWSCPVCSSIHGAMVELRDAGKPIDDPTILRAVPTLTASTIADLSDRACLSTAIEHHADAIVSASQKRQIGQALQEASQCLAATDTDPVDLALAVSTDLARLACYSTAGGPTVGKELVRQAVLELKRRHQSGDKSTGISTGFCDLDERLCGLVPGDLIILAARPSMGKSALALHFLLKIAKQERNPALFFSAEMSKESLTERALSTVATVPGANIRSGELSALWWQQLGRAAKELIELPWYVDDSPGLSVQTVHARSRQLQRSKGLSVVVVDYLQLLESGRGDHQTREREVAAMSRDAKQMAKSLGVPVIMLSQLNRKVEERDNKRPVLSDLRDSGSIEQDADVVLMLYRDEAYNVQTESPGVCEVLIRKNRNGVTGTVELRWLGEFTAFHNLTNGDRYE